MAQSGAEKILYTTVVKYYSVPVDAVSRAEYSTIYLHCWVPLRLHSVRCRRTVAFCTVCFDAFHISTPTHGTNLCFASALMAWSFRFATNQNESLQKQILESLATWSVVTLSEGSLNQYATSAC
jgi:hypothetical protein